MNKLKKIILPLMFLIVVIVLTVCFLYFSKIEEKKEITNKAYVEAIQDFANRKQEDEERKIKILKEDLKQESIISEGLYEPAGNGSYWFIVKEIGIKFKVDSKIRNLGLVYYYSADIDEKTKHKIETVGFSSRAAEIFLERSCFAEKAPAGELTKIEGTLENNKEMEDYDFIIARSDIRQMNGFVIYSNDFRGPRESPWENSCEEYLFKKGKGYLLPNLNLDADKIEEYKR